MKRVHAIVDGTVQGVGFRYTMRGVAQRAGASGWVRNRRDGSVEAEIQGAESAVDEVLAWAAEGPPGAAVTAVRTTPASIADAEQGFAIHPDA